MRGRAWILRAGFPGGGLGALPLLLLWGALAPLQGQTPPLPLPVPLPDSLLVEGAGEPVMDTIPSEELRQVLPRNLPSGGADFPAGVDRGVWEWDRTTLLNQPWLTLHDLLSTIPGVTMVRGGDFGSPVGISWGGLGGGQVRVFLDGVEDAPQESGVVDLAQIGLTGLERVRVERGPGELRIHLVSHRIDESRPLTVLEVGTGDFRTNLFRAGFVHPDALGGTILVALDRLDTDGPRRAEPGALFGTRFRYTLFPAEGMGVALEYRSRTARRPEETWEPREVDRSEWSARLGWEVTESLTAEFHALRGRVSPGQRAAEGADTLLPAEARSSLGGRLTLGAGPLTTWAGGAVLGGLGLPSSRLEAGATAVLEGIGGVTGRFDLEQWSDEARSGRGSERARNDAGTGGWAVRGWTDPRAGISLFAEAEEGRRGIPFVVAPAPAPDEDPGNGDAGDGEGGNGETNGNGVDPTPFDPVRVVERTGLRAGAQAEWRGARVTGAWVRTEASALAPFELPFDRGAALLPGGVRSGIEVEGVLPLGVLLDGLSLSGTGAFWDEGDWRYLPERTWTGAVNWYREGYDGNLEIWADVGVRGRDPMLVFQDGEAVEMAPFTQSWFARLQFRVVTVRVFVQWENLSFRDENADLPGRVQPQTRAMYGVRWTMWN